MFLKLIKGTVLLNFCGESSVVNSADRREGVDDLHPPEGLVGDDSSASEPLSLSHD